jgi:hypothetical protein
MDRNIVPPSPPQVRVVDDATGRVLGQRDVSGEFWSGDFPAGDTGYAGWKPEWENGAYFRYFWEQQAGAPTWMYPGSQTLAFQLSEAGQAGTETEVTKQRVRPGEDASSRRRLELVGPRGDDYLDRLLKYIPVEIIGVYLALTGVVASINDTDPRPWLWVAFIFGLAITPIYLHQEMKVRSPIQIAVSTFAFLAWAFALGGPWRLMSWYHPFQGTLLLIAVAFAAKLVIPKPDSRKNAGNAAADASGGGEAAATE